jgi:hypothetical protein
MEIYERQITIEEIEKRKGEPVHRLLSCYRSTSAAITTNETTCSVKKGGVMLMRPLLQHASSRTTNGNRRRVIHIELSNLPLPPGLEWAEKMAIH